MVTLINHFVKFNILSLSTNFTVKLLTLLLFIIITLNIINTYVFFEINIIYRLSILNKRL